MCVYKKEGDQNELLFIIEYKAPHKLTKEILRVGLREMDLSMEVINRPTIPTNPQKKFAYNADRLVAAAMTQTYSYMLHSGVEYGCVITGEAMAFLWIKEDDSKSLYYHLAEPNEEVSHNAESEFPFPQTAISQLLSFCLISFQSKRRSQQWRDTSVGNAQTWTEDWEKILHDIPEEESKLDPPSSAYKARTYLISDLSPYYLRKGASRPSTSTCSPEIDPTRDSRDDSPEGSDDEPESNSTPSKRGGPGVSARRGENRRQGTQDFSSAGSKHRQYCTQRCLLGLVQRFALDNDCPNARFHRQGKRGRTHLLNRQQFCELVQQQLAADLDNNVKELKKQGIRGALFQITLISHGYTFVGRATNKRFIPALEHEGRIYDRLENIQGNMIPVYLGNIDLVRPWHDLNIRLVHMLLMSWGGERVDNKVEGLRNLNLEVKRFEHQIERLGVRHNDLHLANILWNDQNQKMIFIDFDSAREIRERVLQEASSNSKRKREVIEEGVAAGMA